MKLFLKQNAQFIFLILTWIIAGFISDELASVIVLLSLMLLKSKNRYSELIIAFCLILFLADNRHHHFDFAREIKDIALVLVSAFVLFDKKQFPQKSRLFYPFTAFLLLSFIMCYRHPTPFLSLQKTISYLLMFAVVPNYFVKILNENAEAFFRNFILFFATLLFIGLTMIIWKNDEVYYNGRFNGLLGNPNGAGTYCVVFSILIASVLFHFPNLLSKTELFYIGLCIVITLILCSSRNAIFSILIFLFFKRFYKISSIIGFVIVIISVLLFQILSQYLPQIISSLGLGSYLRIKHLDDGSGRLIAWSFGWREIQNNFLFGRGFAYEEYFFDINKEALSEEGHQGGIHNAFLAVWMNTGLAGLILFLVAWFRIFFKAAANSYLAIPTLFTLLFANMFESWINASLSPYTIIALLIITTLQYKKTDGAASQENTVPVL